MAGILLVGIGLVWLYRQVGFYTPDWLFSWPMILIVVGIFVGVKNNFTDFGWVIMVGIGGFFLADKWWPEYPFKHYIWPGIIIIAGLIMITGPRRRWFRGYVYERDDSNPEASSASYEEPRKRERREIVDVVSIFAAVKKTIYSKNFRGGDAVCIFGGCELNLEQADFQSPIVLDLVNIFGGTKLIVPPHWEIRTDAAVIFGGIDDKRKDLTLPPEEHARVLIIKGAIIFGGIEIKSY